MTEPTAEQIRDVMRALGKRGGKKGGLARAASLTPERRSEIAKTASLAAAKKRMAKTKRRKAREARKMQEKKS